MLCKTLSRLGFCETFKNPVFDLYNYVISFHACACYFIQIWPWIDRGIKTSCYSVNLPQTSHLLVGVCVCGLFASKEVGIPLR